MCRLPGLKRDRADNTLGGVVQVRTRCRCHNPKRHRSSFKNCRNEAGMSMKTKGGCGKLPNEAGMLLITKDVLAKSGNVTENKGFIYCSSVP
jgi:hypothetical protein